MTTPARHGRWAADLATLVRLRHGPVLGPDPRAFADVAGDVTVEVAFAAARAPRRRVLLHQGDLSAVALPPGHPGRTTGWSFAILDGGAECIVWGPAGGAAWVASLGDAGWHEAALTLRFGDADDPPRLLAGWIDGSRFRPAPVPNQEDALGELPVVQGLVLGGSRDRAGGHTDLRFGERPGEWVGRWRVAGGAPTRPPRQAADVDREPPAVTLRADADVLRYRAAPLAEGDAVVWDAEDGLHYGDAIEPLAAVVPAAVVAHWWPRGGVPRPLPVPAPPAGARPATVFAPGDGAYAAFRIPAIVRAGDGALLAFAEGRRESISDSCPTKHLVLRRSADDGAAWGPPEVVAGEASRSLMNPSPVVSGSGDDARVVLVYSRLTADEWSIAAGRGRATRAARHSVDH